MQTTHFLSVSFEQVIEPLTPASERAFQNGVLADSRERSFIPCRAYANIKKLCWNTAKDAFSDIPC